MGWTTVEAAEFLGVSNSFVKSLIYRGKLAAKKHGRDWDIDPESVKAYKVAPKQKGGRPTGSKDIKPRKKRGSG